MGVVFAGKLVYGTKLHWNGYILFSVHVVFVGRLVCSERALYVIKLHCHWTGRREHQSMSQFRLVYP